MVSIAVIIATLCSSQTRPNVNEGYYNSCYTELTSCIDRKETRYFKSIKKGQLLLVSTVNKEQDWLKECLR